MIRKIILHGSLKKRYEGTIQVDALTASEAIRGMCVVTNGAFDPTPDSNRVRISIAGFDTYDQLIAVLPDEVEELHVFPAMVGGKRGGTLQVIIGAVIIVAAVAITVFSGGTGVGLAGTMAGWGLSMGSLALAGALMVAGGLIQMLSPSPKIDTGGMTTGVSDPEASRHLGAPHNTTQNGTRIPLGYGRTRVYGHILSFDIQATDGVV